MRYEFIILRTQKTYEETNEEIQLTVYDQLFLESMLLEIRGKTVSYANNKKKKKL